VPGNELTGLGDTEQVAAVGQPEVTDRLTVPLYPPKEAKESVYEAVLPAPTL
jgi:hypothetical protein